MFLPPVSQALCAVYRKSTRRGSQRAGIRRRGRPASSATSVPDGKELEASNDALVSANQKLQEENRKLTALNRAFEKKVNELNTLKNDMNNLLTSTNIAAVFGSGIEIEIIYSRSRQYVRPEKRGPFKTCR